MSIETPAALFALSDFAEHTDGSGEAWAAFQEVDAHITALQAEVARLQARERELETAIREHLRLEDTTESDDPGVGIDRYAARQKLAALAAVSAETEDS